MNKAIENDNIIFGLPDKIRQKLIEFVADELAKGSGEYSLEIVKENKSVGCFLPYKMTMYCNFKDSHNEHIHPGLTFEANFGVS